MIQDTSKILVHVKHNPLGKKESETFEWSGRSPFVWLSWIFLGEIVGIGGDTINVQVGPYKLLKIEHDYQRDAVLYVRQDKFGAVRVMLYKATRLLDLIYRRAIVTLAVWYLAEFNHAVIPSWRDIKILKGFTKK